jgi:SAM-dependent methyltransferase
VTTPTNRIRGYEELDGAFGSKVFYRPPKHGAAELAPLVSNVYVQRALTGSIRCDLLEISEEGLAFDWTQESPPLAGESVSLTVGFDEHVVYRGEAAVTGSSGSTFNASFSGLVKLDELARLRTVRNFASQPAQSWRVAGNAQFKSLVSDLALYLQDAEARLRGLESELDVVSPASQTALIGRLRRELVPEVVHAGEAIDAALREASPTDKKALNELSLRHLDGYLMQAPWMHRARTKPFGYPGDFEVMRFIYEKPFEGPTLFARAVGYAFLQTKAALAVKYRKDLMRQQLGKAVARHGSSPRALRFLSVAAGPAQELVELLSDLPELHCPLEIVLFDQDRNALSHAFRRLQPLVTPRISVLYLNESIKRLLRDANLFAGFGHFDVIYSAGLYDYLQPSTAVVLTRNLFAQLSPGGVLCVGNMAPENPCRWFMESHLDWHLLHRTREEMREIAHRASPTAQIRVLEEESGVNPFIELKAV